MAFWHKKSQSRIPIPRNEAFEESEKKTEIQQQDQNLSSQDQQLQNTENVKQNEDDFINARENLRSNSASSTASFVSSISTTSTETASSVLSSSTLSLNKKSQNLSSSNSNRKEKAKANNGSLTINQKKSESKTNPNPKPPFQPPQPQQVSHPLAKAMKKRQPKLMQKSAETFAEEKIESVSQKLRGQSKQDRVKRWEDMEKQLTEAEAQLCVMTELLDKREKLLQETQEDAVNKTAALEEKIEDQKEKLIVNGIDPVTGDKIMTNDEDKQKVESSKKFTKKRIQEMREKLREMNARTESYLVDIENTVNYLDSMEESSIRAGPISEDLQNLISGQGTDEFIALVYAENVPPKKKEEENEDDISEDEPEKNRRQSPYGRNSPEDDEKKDNKEAGKEEEIGEQGEEENGSEKIFLTSRNSTIVDRADEMTVATQDNVSQVCDS